MPTATGSVVRVGESWRGCLEPPAVADGEDEVVAWLVETVLGGGSAVIDDVAFGRVRPLRQRVARQIKAAVGGRVRTSLVSATTLLAYSSLVIDARPRTASYRRCATPWCACQPARRVIQSANRTEADSGHRSCRHEESVLPPRRRYRAPRAQQNA